MGTKNNPGAFDCYENAKPDEPMFVLLGRDKFAPAMVWLWATLRELDEEDPAVVKEARECSAAMADYAADLGKPSVGVGQSVIAGLFELIRMANYGGKLLPQNPTSEEDMRRFLCTTEFEKARTPNTESPE